MKDRTLAEETNPSDAQATQVLNGKARDRYQAQKPGSQWDSTSRISSAMLSASAWPEPDSPAQAGRIAVEQQADRAGHRVSAQVAPDLGTRREGEEGRRRTAASGRAGARPSCGGRGAGRVGKRAPERTGSVSMEMLEVGGGVFTQASVDDPPLVDPLHLGKGVLSLGHGGRAGDWVGHDGVCRCDS